MGGASGAAQQAGAESNISAIQQSMIQSDASERMQSGIGGESSDRGYDWFEQMLGKVLNRGKWTTMGAATGNALDVFQVMNQVPGIAQQLNLGSILGTWTPLGPQKTVELDPSTTPIGNNATASEIFGSGDLHGGELGGLHHNAPSGYSPHHSMEMGY